MHAVTNRKALLTRVRRIRGQADALERQLESGSDCGEVLQQIAAIRGAVNGLMAAVMAGHLSEHLVNEPDQAVREAELGAVLRVIGSYLK